MSHREHEARRLLYTEAHRVAPGANADAKRTAAEALLMQLSKLAGPEVPRDQDCGLLTRFLREHVPGPAVMVGHERAAIRVDYFQGDFRVLRGGQWGKRVELVEEFSLPFDPIAGVFFSAEIDKTMTPVPGEPLPTRSPLAILLAAALRGVRAAEEAEAA